MTAPLPSRPSEVKAWCSANGFRPSRALGQNFLIDRNTVEAIVAVADVRRGERILEVGPGMGALTRALLEAGASVTAVEKDEALAALLRESCGGYPDFTLHTADMLDIPLDALLSSGAAGTAGQERVEGDVPVPSSQFPVPSCPIPRSPFPVPYFSKLISNLPYSVGTRILLEVCRHPLAPATCLVMVQKEVADRLAAAPSTPDRGQAGVWIQQRYDVETVRTVKPTCFWPQPEISSTVIRLVRHDRLPLDDAERRLFEAITKLAFMHRRKQMASIFRNAGPVGAISLGDPAAWLASCGLAPSVRPEQISNEQWRQLACALADNAGKEV